MGTGRAGRLGTQSAEAAAACGVPCVFRFGLTWPCSDWLPPITDQLITMPSPAARSTLRRTAASKRRGMCSNTSSDIAQSERRSDGWSTLRSAVSTSPPESSAAFGRPSYAAYAVTLPAARTKALYRPAPAPSSVTLRPEKKVARHRASFRSSLYEHWPALHRNDGGSDGSLQSPAFRM